MSKKTDSTPRPPKHLSAAGKRFWLEVSRTWRLECHHYRLLTLAVEAADRCEQARETIAREGLTTQTKDGGLRPHPCVVIERDSRAAVGKLISQLGLDLAEVPSARDLSAGGRK